MLRRYSGLLVLFLVGVVCSHGRQPTLALPPRPADAMSGSALVRHLAPLPRKEREQAIRQQVLRGNVPAFVRALVPVTATAEIDGTTRTAVFYTTPDYLCLGSDADYFLTPMTPALAQQLADRLRCCLPTRKMVDDIHRAAVKLIPAPIPPSASMITVPVFADHNVMVARQRAALLAEHPLGALVAGHKKDVVLTPELLTHPGKVAIYGWHYPDGRPIQPLNLGHVDWYADYSHGVRLVQRAMTVDGATTSVPAVLADPELWPLLCDEGPFSCRYTPVPH